MAARLVAAALCLVGCTGSIAHLPAPGDEPTAGTGSAGVPGGGMTAMAGAGGGAMAGQPGRPAACGVAPSARVIRLGHAQYDQTLRGLLGLSATASPSARFIPDPVVNGFRNQAKALELGSQLARDYQDQAERLAEEASENAASLALLAPCKVQATCADDFIASFGLRAFRRPLSTDERTAYRALFAQGPSLYGGGDPLARGVRVVIEAMLQSPAFLYRTELDDTSVVAGVRRLSGFERASRLAFLIWGAGPDDDLLAAAGRGELDDDTRVVDRVGRMLQDGRARANAIDFHRQWLAAEHIKTTPVSAQTFPAFTLAAQAAALESFDAFVGGIFASGGGYGELMAGSAAFINNDLAPLYGQSKTVGTMLVRTPLDPGHRAGVLSQIAFLAGHASADSSAPIRRGVFLLRHVLCADIPDPPADAVTTLPPRTDDVRTTRQHVTAATSAPRCATCHATLINPAGFLFEAFDASGAHRTTEGGVAIDPSGKLTLDDVERNFAGPASALQAIAASKQGRSCYAREWLRYALARTETDDDRCLLDQLVQRMDDPSSGMTDVVRTIATSPVTLSRREDATP